MRGLSSVYGFIVTYLLVMSSLQAISAGSSALVSLQQSTVRALDASAAQRLERLSLTMAGGNLTVKNVGEVSSVVEYILLRSSGTTREVSASARLEVGESLSWSAGGAAEAVVVTSLGSVFSVSRSGSSAPGSAVLWDGLGGPLTPMQLFQNPLDPSRFFVSEGSSVYELSSSGGARWEFSAGEGTITDILPLPSGYVYASDGYIGRYTAQLVELSPGGTPVNEFPVRLLRTYSAQEMQYPDLDSSPLPVGSSPVQKGTDSYYASYDGWFFSPSGVSSTSFPSDQFSLAGSDAGHFYVYHIRVDSGRDGCSAPYGNELELRSYAAGSTGVSEEWTSYLHFNACSANPEALLSASVAGGVIAMLFETSYSSQPGLFVGPTQGLPTYLAVFTTSGMLVYGGYLEQSDYSGVVTDGSYVYLVLPAMGEVEQIPVIGGAPRYVRAPGAFSSLESAYGSFFAISAGSVYVFNATLGLTDSISFAPLTLYSSSNPLPFESALHSPSFIPLNSTTYVALLRNQTGFGTLVTGSYR